MVQPHQHSSLPLEVRPHLGWLWRIFMSPSLLLSSSNRGTQIFTMSNITCITNAKKAAVIINVGLGSSILVNVIIWNKNKTERRENYCIVDICCDWLMHFSSTSQCHGFFNNTTLMGWSLRWEFKNQISIGRAGTQALLEHSHCLMCI